HIPLLLELEVLSSMFCSSVECYVFNYNCVATAPVEPDGCFHKPLGFLEVLRRNRLVPSLEAAIYVDNRIASVVKDPAPATIYYNGNRDLLDCGAACLSCSS